uniref:Putative secreted protein n=1 Tax=Anopheles darlingi TaxID=43151 RepID=A0A2M4DJY0_ANODA
MLLLLLLLLLDHHGLLNAFLGIEVRCVVVAAQKRNPGNGKPVLLTGLNRMRRNMNLGRTSTTTTKKTNARVSSVL